MFRSLFFQCEFDFLFVLQIGRCFFRNVFKDAVCLMFGPFSPHFGTVSAIWGSLFGALGTILGALGVILGALGAHLVAISDHFCIKKHVSAKKLTDPNYLARF